MIIDRFSHPTLAKGEEIIVYRLSWQFILRFAVAVPNNQFPSEIAIRMSRSFEKFNKEMDEAEKYNEHKVCEVCGEGKPLLFKADEYCLRVIADKYVCSDCCHDCHHYMTGICIPGKGE